MMVAAAIQLRIFLFVNGHARHVFCRQLAGDVRFIDDNSFHRQAVHCRAGGSYVHDREASSFILNIFSFVHHL